KNMNEFAEGDEGIQFFTETSHVPSDELLKGQKKNEDEIEEFTRNLFQLEDNLDVMITKSMEDANVQTYSDTYEDGKNVYMDITERGGHPLQILVERPIEKSKLSLHDGLQKAQKYLQSFDYTQMIPYQTQQYDNVGLFSFVSEQDGVRIYPDSITMKVALDDR